MPGQSFAEQLLIYIECSDMDNPYDTLIPVPFYLCFYAGHLSKAQGRSSLSGGFSERLRLFRAVDAKEANDDGLAIYQQLYGVSILDADYLAYQYSGFLRLRITSQQAT